MYNTDLRTAIHKAGFHGYEVAQALGISECHFSRKLSRSELSGKEKQRIYEALKSLYQARMNELSVNPIGEEESNVSG